MQAIARTTGDRRLASARGRATKRNPPHRRPSVRYLLRLAWLAAAQSAHPAIRRSTPPPAPSAATSRPASAPAPKLRRTTPDRNAPSDIPRYSAEEFSESSSPRAAGSMVTSRFCCGAWNMTPVTAHTASSANVGTTPGGATLNPRKRERDTAQAEGDGAVRTDAVREPPGSQVADDPADAEHEERDGAPRGSDAGAVGEIRQQQRISGELRGHLQQRGRHAQPRTPPRQHRERACGAGPGHRRWCRAPAGTQPLPPPDRSDPITSSTARQPTSPPSQADSGIAQHGCQHHAAERDRERAPPLLRGRQPGRDRQCHRTDGRRALRPSPASWRTGQP